MRNSCFFIALVLMICGFGCRSHKEAHGVSRRDLLTETNIEARRLDSVSLSENFYRNIIIDYFPPSDSAHPIDVSAILEETGLPTAHGAVRRVTVETGRNATVVRTVADTVAVHESLSESESEKVDVVEDRNKESLPIPAVIILIGALLSLLVIYRMGK